jgi:hypothetical protein
MSISSTPMPPKIINIFPLGVFLRFASVTAFSAAAVCPVSAIIFCAIGDPIGIKSPPHAEHLLPLDTIVPHFVQSIAAGIGGILQIQHFAHDSASDKCVAVTCFSKGVYVNECGSGRKCI